MIHEPPAICPVCDAKLHITRLSCRNCGSVLKGRFKLEGLANLPAEMQRFVVIFLKSRGNIREMEKIYGISYPTVRARIDEILELLDETAGANAVKSDGIDKDAGGAGGAAVKKTAPDRLEILRMLADGEIDTDKAHDLLLR